MSAEFVSRTNLSLRPVRWIPKQTLDRVGIFEVRGPDPFESIFITTIDRRHWGNMPKLYPDAVNESVDDVPAQLYIGLYGADAKYAQRLIWPVVFELSQSNELRREHQHFRRLIPSRVVASRYSAEILLRASEHFARVLIGMEASCGNSERNNVGIVAGDGHDAGKTVCPDRPESPQEKLCVAIKCAHSLFAVGVRRMKKPITTQLTSQRGPMVERQPGEDRGQEHCLLQFTPMIAIEKNRKDDAADLLCAPDAQQLCLDAVETEREMESVPLERAHRQPGHGRTFQAHAEIAWMEIRRPDFARLHVAESLHNSIGCIAVHP